MRKGKMPSGDLQEEVADKEDAAGQSLFGLPDMQ